MNKISAKSVQTFVAGALSLSGFSLLILDTLLRCGFPEHRFSRLFYASGLCCGLG